MSQQFAQYVGDPDSPQASTEIASIQDNKQKNIKALERGLKTRRPVEELVNQGIMTQPGIYNPDTMKRLDRAKKSDILKHKIEKRPDKQYLIDQHILKADSMIVSPILAEKREMLEKNQLKESLNSKLAHRPGSLELVEKGVLHLAPRVQNLIREGSISYPRVALGSSFTDTSTIDYDGSNSNAAASSALWRQEAVDDDSLLGFPLNYSPIVQQPQDGIVFQNSPNSVMVLNNQPKQEPSSESSFPIASTPDIICVVQPQQIAASISTASNAASSILNNSYYSSSVDNRRSSGRVVKTKKEHVSKFRGLFFHNYTPGQPQQQQKVRELQQEEFLRLQADDAGVQVQLSQLEQEIRQRDKQAAPGSLIPSTKAQQSSTDLVPPPPPPPPLPPSKPLDKRKSGLEHFTVPQLKLECRQRNLPRSGTKNALIRSLEPYKAEILRQYGLHATVPIPITTTVVNLNSPSNSPSLQSTYAPPQTHLNNPSVIDPNSIIPQLSMLKHSSSAPQFETQIATTCIQPIQNIPQDNQCGPNFNFSNCQTQGVPSPPSTQQTNVVELHDQKPTFSLDPLQPAFTSSLSNIFPKNHTLNPVNEIIINDNSIETIKMLHQKMNDIRKQIISNLQLTSQYKRSRGEQCPEIVTLMKEREALVDNNSHLKQITIQLVNSRLEALSEEVVGQLTANQSSGGVNKSIGGMDRGDVSLDSQTEARIEEINWLQTALQKLEPQDASTVSNGYRERSATDSVGSSASFGDSSMTQQRSWSDSYNGTPNTTHSRANNFIEPSSMRVIKNTSDDDLLLINQIIQDDKTGSSLRAGDSFKQSSFGDDNTDMLDLGGSSNECMFDFTSQVMSNAPDHDTKPITEDFYELDFDPMSPMQTDNDDYSNGSCLNLGSSSMREGANNIHRLPQQQVVSGGHHLNPSISVSHHQLLPPSATYAISSGRFTTASTMGNQLSCHQQQLLHQSQAPPPPAFKAEHHPTTLAATTNHHSVGLSSFPFEDLCYEMTNGYSSTSGALSVNFSGSEQILTPGTEIALFQSLQQNSMDTTDNDVFLQDIGL